MVMQCVLKCVDNGGRFFYNLNSEIFNSNEDSYYIPATIKTLGYNLFDNSSGRTDSIHPSLYFQGDAPEFDANAFLFGEEIICYYDKDNATWDDVIGYDYGAEHVMWIGIDASGLFPYEDSENTVEPTEIQPEEEDSESESHIDNSSDISSSVISQNSESSSTEKSSEADSLKVSPKTGDERHMPVWIMLLTFAFGAVLFYHRFHTIN